MWTFIKTYTFRYWKLYFCGFLALIITNFVAVKIPLKIKDTVDLIENPTSLSSELSSVIVSLIILAMILAASRTLSRIFIFIPGRNVEYDLRNKLYKHLLTLSSDYFQTEKVGDLMSRLINDIQSLRAMSALGFLHIINTVMIYFFAISQMIAIKLPLTLYIIAPIPIVMILIRGLVKRLYLHTKENQESLGQLSNYFVETLASIQVIKSYGAEESFFEAFQKPNQDYFNNNIKLSRIRSTMFPFIAIIGSLGYLILLIIGGNLIINQELSLGEFAAFMGYIGLLTWPTASLAWIINIIQRGKSSLQRLNAIFDTVPSIIDAPNINLNQNITSAPELTVENLSFSYPNSDTPSLSNINFTLKPGKTLGVFGPTGSGKTTLAKLLSRTEIMPKDAYFINEKECHSWPIQTLRESVSYVPQNPFLFSMSISDNIQFSQPQLKNLESEEEKTTHLIEASKLACVYDEILTFKEKFDTIIGEKGVILSGGQKNRLTLARALYKPHHILILDDVLSAVDHNTEKKLIANLKALKNTPTTLLISHRISALTHCDEILVLDKGQTVMQGTHQELIQKEGLYKNTWLYQQMEEDEISYDG